jgi:hypothetical protein
MYRYTNQKEPAGYRRSYVALSHWNKTIQYLTVYRTVLLCRNGVKRASTTAERNKVEGW